MPFMLSFLVAFDRRDLMCGGMSRYVGRVAVWRSYFFGSVTPRRDGYGLLPLTISVVSFPDL